MSRTFRMAMLSLSGCALSAGQATPPPPLAVQAAPAPDVRSRDYLELSGNLPQAFATARQLGPADAQAPPMDSMILVLKPPPGA